MLRHDDSPMVAVFSHPNHELAVFGLLQSERPALVYLTDGGGERRVEQTRRGLAGIGLADSARYLGYAERSFYEALLEQDVAFFLEVAARVRDALTEVAPSRVLCDAVEFYNPVHDLSLPIVRRALRGASQAEVFEVPLVQQKNDEIESYRVQRMSDGDSGPQLAWRLSLQQVEAKLEARDRIYTILTEQMGDVLASIPPADLAVEMILPARSTLPKPGGERVLRYERRARMLLARGEIERMITFAGHYLPVAEALF